MTALRGRPLTRSDSLGIPVKIIVIGDELAVIDHAMDHVLQFYDRASGRHVWSGLAWGDGPGEVRMPWSIHLREGRACVWDPQLSKSACVEPPGPGGEDGTGGRDLVISDSTLFRKGMGLVDIAIASDTLLVGTSLQEPGRFVLIDSRTGRATGFLSPELPVSETQRKRLGQILYNGDLKMRPGTDQFVFAPRFGGEIFVGTLSSGEVRRIEGPEPFSAAEAELKILKRNDGSQFRVGYVSIDVTDRAVYGLFSNRVIGRAESLAAAVRAVDSAFSTRQLHVFSWATERWRTIELDTAGVMIAVAEPYLYMIVREELPDIRVYDLDDVADVAARDRR